MPIVLFVLVAIAGAVYVHVQTRSDARANAESDARLAATAASRELGTAVASLNAGVAQLAGNKELGLGLRNPAACSLAYSLSAPTDRSHIDVLRPGGAVGCSSRKASVAERTRGYVGASWIRRASAGPVFLAPVIDRMTGAPVALVAAPAPGVGLVAGFADLRALGPQVGRLFAGGRAIEFLVTTGGDRTVVTRSIEPGRWIGKPLAASAFALDRGTRRRDLDGTVRFYESARIPGTGWTLYAGESEASVLAAGTRLERRQQEIIAFGLAIALLSALLIYRRVARPITRLGASVRSAEGGTYVTVPVEGPAEVRDLAEDVNALVSSVDAELVERRRAEEQARLSEESYRYLFDQHPGALWVYDVDTLRFLAVNETAVAMYGYTREEFLAMTIEDIRPEADRAALRAAVTDRGRGRVDAGVWRHVKKDGTIVEAAISSNEIDFEGRPARLVIAQDVTAERTLEEQLRRAQKMEAIGSLAGGVAHDFNNILMVIRTCGALLTKRIGDEPLVNQIDAAAERAAELTHQLLAFSRQQVLRPEVTDLNAVVNETLVLLKRLISEDITIACDLDPGLRSIVVDRSQLGQVLLNLAVNARDAMQDGGVLAIRTANVDLDDLYAAEHIGVEPGTYSMLQVTDSGAGMDEETRSRAFDPFFTTKEDAGTGLGLATVYGIVSQSGGHIWLYSEPEMGTTFKVYFPVAGVPAAPAADRAAPAAPEGRETVLLVEDEPAVRPLVARALALYGYTVLEAANGPEALELARQHGGRIDLLLTDVVMPEMNGRELAERLTSEHPGVRVLFTSGYPADTIIRHGIAEARADFIEKPYLPDELARRVRETLDATREATS